MYLGDFLEDSSVYIGFTTHASTGGNVDPNTTFEADDFTIFKNNSEVEKTTTNGVVVTNNFNGLTGVTGLSIDTSNDTGDTGFWVTGADYMVILSPNETIDGESVNANIGQFSIENRQGSTLKIPFTVGVGSTTTTIETDLSLGQNDLVNGRRVIFPSTGQVAGITDYNDATGALTVTTLITPPGSGELGRIV